MINWARLFNKSVEKSVSRECRRFSETVWTEELKLETTITSQNVVFSGVRYKTLLLARARSQCRRWAVFSSPTSQRKELLTEKKSVLFLKTRGPLSFLHFSCRKILGRRHEASKVTVAHVFLLCPPSNFPSVHPSILLLPLSLPHPPLHPSAHKSKRHRTLPSPPAPPGPLFTASSVPLRIGFSDHIHGGWLALHTKSLCSSSLSPESRRGQSAMATEQKT